MYQNVKNIVKSIVPKSSLQNHEQRLRRLYASIFFRGNAQRCNICEHHFSKFIILNNEDKLCPFCGSISRNRLLWQVLNDHNFLNGRILHFSPSRPLFHKLKQKKGIEYISSDFENEFLADKKLDITKIDEPDESFDTIICYHVLEHILNDRQAMNELFRVLKTGGTAILQTPFKEGDIYEDFSIVTKEDRLKHFDQEDHVRIYSAEGLANRLQLTGFQVNINNFNNHAVDNSYGFKKKETILFSRKK